MDTCLQHQRNGPLNQQLYADMFGWDEMARETARAYYALPPDIRASSTCPPTGSRRFLTASAPLQATRRCASPKRQSACVGGKGEAVVAKLPFSGLKQRAAADCNSK
jgi:hypothetical protein